jgi:glutamate-1-semialdehyde 2,1-aminomutase
MNRDEMNDEYRKRLHRVIPGGAHTYSRGDDQFPANAPAILESSTGAYAFSPDGRKFIDYSMGLRSVNIGYGNKEIADACYAEMLKGNNLARASVTELTAAELLAEMIPSVEMVKFAKHGSTVTSAAVKLARAYTGRKYIAVPKEHPFFSFDDWFIGSTVVDRGVPDDIRRLTLHFHYNDTRSLEKLFEEHPGEIAGVILEPATTVGPLVTDGSPEIPYENRPAVQHNFLHQVQELCRKNGSVFIIDEMITGFRWHLQGAQTYYGIDPDLSTFGKAMANGFALSALCGKREIMQLGNILNEGHQRVFLTSTTHGAEMSALGAFLKTVEVMKRDRVIEHNWDFGRKLSDGMNAIAAELGIQKHFYVEGYGCSPNYITKNEQGEISFPLRTLFSQEMIRNNILMPFISISYAHDTAELDQTLSAVRTALGVVRQALESGIDQYLHSPVIKPVFRKFN